MTQVHFVVSISIGIPHTKPTNGSRLRSRQYFPADIHKARSIARQHPLVTCRAKRVDLHSLNIDLEDTSSLARINNQCIASLNASQFIESNAETIGVLHLAHRNYSRSCIHCLAHVIQPY